MSQTEHIQLPKRVLGGSDAAEFSRKVQDSAAAGVTKLILDLSAVEVMNSSGLGMLVAAHSTMKRHGGTLSFLHTPEVVMKLLRMTHLETVFHFEQTNEGSQS